jgi:hypothetical protein
VPVGTSDCEYVEAVDCVIVPTTDLVGPLDAVVRELSAADVEAELAAELL